MDAKIHVEDFDFIGIDRLKLCEMYLSEVNQMITTRITVDSKEVGAYDQRTIEQRVFKNEQALQAQADWNQNNADIADYVKNRTHWKEIVTTPVAIFGESTVTTTVNSKGYYVKAGLSYSNGAVIDEGNTFRVTFNGTVYSCIPKKATETATTANSLGNLSLMDSSKEDTGEPFMFRTGSPTLALLATREAGDFTLQVDRMDSKEVYHKLDTNFLPLVPIDLTIVTEEGQTVTYNLWGREISDET